MATNSAVNIDTWDSWYFLVRLLSCGTTNTAPTPYVVMDPSVYTQIQWLYWLLISSLAAACKIRGLSDLRAPPPPTQPALPPRPKAGTGGPATGPPVAPPPPLPGPSPGWSRGRERRNGQWQGPRSRPTPPHPLNYQWSATETDGTLPAQRTGFNTLDNWGHKIPAQSKRIKYKKEKIKGSWPGICIQYTRLHVHRCISLRVQSLSETGKWPQSRVDPCLKLLHVDSVCA